MSVVLVTGASSGIGRATALALASRGDTVVLASRSESALEEVAVACRALGGDALVAPTDVGDRHAVESLFALAAERLGRIDAVVNSAAVLAYGRFEDLPAAVFDRVQQTNVIGAANVARAALHHFAEHGGGSLVLVGSVIGKICTPTMSSYVTGKWAVHGLARTLQLEARRTPGIDVSLVSPGSVDTPIYRLAGSYTGHSHRPPPPVDPPERVAAKILQSLERPRRELSVGLANHAMVAGFRLFPAVFDRLVGPLVGVFGTSRASREPSPGNVLDPDPGGESVHGGWWSLPLR